MITSTLCHAHGIAAPSSPRRACCGSLRTSRSRASKWSMATMTSSWACAWTSRVPRTLSTIRVMTRRPPCPVRLFCWRSHQRVYCGATLSPLRTAMCPCLLGMSSPRPPRFPNLRLPKRRLQRLSSRLPRGAPRMTRPRQKGRAVRDWVHLALRSALRCLIATTTRKVMRVQRRVSAK